MVDTSVPACARPVMSCSCSCLVPPRVLVSSWPSTSSDYRTRARVASRAVVEQRAGAHNNTRLALAIFCHAREVLAPGHLGGNARALSIQYARIDRD